MTVTNYFSLSLTVSDSWSRSKGRCSLVGQHSAPSSVPLLSSAPPLSRQQKVTGQPLQQQHPMGFGQVSWVGLGFITSFNAWQYQQYDTIKVVVLSWIFPGLSFRGFFIVKISADDVKWQISHQWIEESQKAQAREEKTVSLHHYAVIVMNQSWLLIEDVSL